MAFFAWNEAQRLIGLPLFQLAGAVLVLLGVGLDPSFLPHRKRPPENEEHPA